MSAKSLSNSYFFSFLVLAIASSVIALVGFVSPAHAQQVGSNFQANRIIDDAVFYNGNGMTAEQVQQFLNARVPVCDTNGTQMYNSTQTRAQWAAANGRPLPPYVCVKDFVAPSTPAKSDSGLCAPIPARTNRTAAQIIDDVARACNISQQALIVTLQKEQSLITDVWPWPVQYEKAMGYYCPDDPTRPGWCAPEFAGFFNQVYNAARQFQRYRQSPNSFNHAINRASFVAYQANAPSCGGTNLTMQTAATAGLYNYTPYQPNPAALNNLYGTGDSCSAYGNRNFWRMYNDWFGSTFADAYQSQPVWQSVFTDNTKTTSLGWNATLRTGQKAYVVLQFRNSGSSIWYRQNGSQETTLGTAQSQDRFSLFCEQQWKHPCNRVVRMAETSVAPGQLATFEFPISAPGAPGIYNESFGLVINGIGYFPNNATIQFNIEPENNSAQPVWQSVFTDSTKSQSLGWNATLRTGQSAYAVIKMRNTGNIAWTKLNGGNDVMLGTVLGQDRVSSFCAGGWLYPCNRPVRLLETSVAPGQLGTFEFPITAPSQPGTYNEAFGLVVNGKGYFKSGFSTITFTVEPERNTAQPVWQSVFTDSTKSQSLGWNATLSRGQPAYIVVIARNTGNSTWTRLGGGNDTMLGTAFSQDRQSSFCAGGWLYPCNRPVRLLETSVAPGQLGTFEFPITAPSQPGTYNEAFGFVVNGKGYFPSSFVSLQLVVN